MVGLLEGYGMIECALRGWVFRCLIDQLRGLINNTAAVRSNESI